MFNKQDKGGDMKFTPEQRQKIYETYMKKVDEITEECDWVTHLSPKEIINILLNIVEKGEYKDD
jgi:hypothetical protein